MLSVLIRLEPALTKAFELGEGNGGLRRGSKTNADAYHIKDWLLLEQMVVVLSMVLNATKPLESSTTITLSKAMGYLNKLDHQLAAPGLDGSGCLVEDLRGQKWDEEGVLAPVRLLKKRLRESLQERFPLIHIKGTLQQMDPAVQAAARPHILAMALDPFLDSDFVDLVPADVMVYLQSPDPYHRECGQRQLGSILAWLKLAAEEVVVEEMVATKLRAGAGGPPSEVTGGGGEEGEEEAAAAVPGGLVALPDAVLDMLGPTTSASGAAGATAAAEAAGVAVDVEQLRADLRQQFQRFRDSRAFQRNQRAHQLENRNTAQRWTHPVTLATKAWKAANGWDKLGREPEMEWWYQNQHNYPDVAQVARAVLPIPAMSAGAERLFSGTGKTVNPYRAKLTPENVRIKTLVRENFHDGLLDMANYSADQQFIGKRKREGQEDEEEGKEGEGGSFVPDYMPPLVPLHPAEGGAATAISAATDRGTEFSPEVREQYSRGDLGRELEAAMGRSAIGLVASSGYFGLDFGLDDVYGDALGVLAEVAAAQVEA